MLYPNNLKKRVIYRYLRALAPLTSLGIKYLYFLLICGISHCFASTENRHVKIVFTSALIDFNYAIRQEEYISSMIILNNYGYQPYVIETCKTSPPSFFENYTHHVFYSNVNDYSLINKGVNEARAMIEGFKHYQFDDEDMIIKLTGRYFFHSRQFLDVVETHPEIDASVKFCAAYPVVNGRVFTGCFAMRCKYFKEMLQQLDFVKMEEELIDLEVEVARYIHRMEEKGCKILYLKDLGMTANIGGPFPPIYTQW